MVSITTYLPLLSPAIPVRPVSNTGQTGPTLAASYRSDRSIRPVRPVLLSQQATGQTGPSDRSDRSYPDQNLESWAWQKSSVNCKHLLGSSSGVHVDAFGQRKPPKNLLEQEIDPNS